MTKTVLITLSIAFIFIGAGNFLYWWTENNGAETIPIFIGNKSSADANITVHIDGDRVFAKKLTPLRPENSGRKNFELINAQVKEEYKLLVEDKDKAQNVSRNIKLSDGAYVNIIYSESGFTIEQNANSQSCCNLIPFSF
jgi:hypothetical protein